MTLQYIRVERLSDGYMVDPRPYIEILPKLAEVLPERAYAFVIDPDHYDVFSERSIKDLKVEQLAMKDSYAVLGVRLDLAYNNLPDVPKLKIEYEDVTAISVDIGRGFQVRRDWINADSKRLSDVLADEIHPDPHGCVHVIETINGMISITCKDLTATWI